MSQREQTNCDAIWYVNDVFFCKCVIHVEIEVALLLILFAEIESYIRRELENHCGCLTVYAAQF